MCKEKDGKATANMQTSVLQEIRQSGHHNSKDWISWCHMNYFNNSLTAFLGLERVSWIAVYEGSEWKLLDFIKNIWICVPKMNEGLTGLGWHERE